MSATDHYIRLHYENDYFSGTDEYYTQGVNLEWVSPSLEKNPLTHLLIVPKGGVAHYGVAIDHNAYTPTSIASNEILYGDRPFAATLLAKTFAASNHAAQRYRITSALSLGMIGKVAGAYEIQKTIHRWIGDTEPQGWQHQIKNDLVVNYEASLEKNIIRSRYFLLNSFTAARLGTLNTKLSAGGTLLAGKLNSALTSTFANTTTSEYQKFTFHFYVQPSIHTVIYDATLQGGLVFQRDSPYTLKPKEIERLTWQANAGFVFSIGSFYAEYFQCIISKEFESGHDHRWGGVKMGILF